MQEQINTKFGSEYHQLEIIDGVLIQTYHPNLRHISLSIAREMILERNDFCSGIKYPVVVDVQNGKSIDHDARMYFGSSEANTHVISGSLVVNNPIAKLICSFVLKFSKYPFPAKIFRNKMDAIKWSKQFRHFN